MLNKSKILTSVLLSLFLLMPSVGLAANSFTTPLYTRANLLDGDHDKLENVYGVNWEASSVSVYPSRNPESYLNKVISAVQKFVRFESHQDGDSENGSAVITTPGGPLLERTKMESESRRDIITQFFQIRTQGDNFSDSVAIYYRPIGSKYPQLLSLIYFEYDSGSNQIILREQYRKEGVLVGTEADFFDNNLPKLYPSGFRLGYVPTILKVGSGYETPKLFVSMPSGSNWGSLQFEHTHKSPLSTEFVLGPMVVKAQK